MSCVEWTEPIVISKIICNVIGSCSIIIWLSDHFWIHKFNVCTPLFGIFHWLCWRNEPNGVHLYNALFWRWNRTRAGSTRALSKRTIRSFRRWVASIEELVKWMATMQRQRCISRDSWRKCIVPIKWRVLVHITNIPFVRKLLWNEMLFFSWWPSRWHVCVLPFIAWPWPTDTKIKFKFIA